MYSFTFLTGKEELGKNKNDMPISTHRLVQLVTKEAKLPVQQVENQLIPLDRLPVTEIGYKLADYYEEAAKIMVTYVGILRHIREIMRDGISLDDPYAREAIRKQEIRLKSVSKEMEETEKRVKALSEELEERSGIIMQSVRLAQVDKCEEGLFILRFRKVDPNTPVGFSYDDSVLIFIDTQAGRSGGALAFVHQPEPEPRRTKITVKRPATKAASTRKKRKKF